MPAVARPVRIVYVCRWAKMVATSLGQASACGGEAKGAVLLTPKRNAIAGWPRKSKVLQTTTRQGEDLMMGMAECNTPDVRRSAGCDVNNTVTLSEPSHLPTYSQVAS